MSSRGARRARTAGLLLAAAIAAPASAKDTPAWLDAARATPSPAPSATLHAHFLLHEHQVTCGVKGRNVIVDRGAVRILDRQATDMAKVTVDYDKTSARVRDLNAWLVMPDGRVVVFGDRDALDVVDADWGTLKTDSRQRRIAAEAVPGAVFGWEWTVEEEPLLADRSFVFGDWIPTAVERFQLDLPAGIEPKVLAFGDGVPAATRVGNSWVWERRDIPALPREPASASGSLWLDWFVASPHAGPGVAPLPGRAFASWAEVAHWLASLSDAGRPPSPGVAAAAARVDGTAAPLARARALGRSVQSVNYVSVSIGLARGEGYRPHPADDVLQTGFGDCKDKANLFCALSRAAGLRAWLVLASTQGRDHVRPEWPSPGQFNHCIAALEVPKGTGLGAVQEGTPLGSLLYFDPTDPYTPFGDLPENLQGSWGLLQDADKGALVQLPVAGERRSRWTFRALIDSTGGLTGTWSSELRGAAASSERAGWSEQATPMRAYLDRSLTDWLGGNRVEGFGVEDAPDSDAFRVRFEVRADRFGRRMGEKMLAFRTAPAVSPFAWESTDTARVTPVALTARARTDSVVFLLPSGWRVDDLPEPVTQERDFGSFTARWAVTGNVLTFTLVTRVKAMTLPPARYRELLAFADAVRRARRTQVVLVHS